MWLAEKLDKHKRKIVRMINFSEINKKFKAIN